MLGRKDRRPGGRGGGGLLPDLVHHLDVLAFHVFGRIDDEDGVAEIGGERRRLSGVGGLDKGGDDAALDFTHRPLAGRIEFADGGDLVPAELNPERQHGPG